MYLYNAGTFYPSLHSLQTLLLFIIAFGEASGQKYSFLNGLNTEKTYKGIVYTEKLTLHYLWFYDWNLFCYLALIFLIVLLCFPGGTPIYWLYGMCRCSCYGFQTFQSRTGCINHWNFCLEQGIKFCNFYKLFSTGCNNSFRMRIGLTGFWCRWSFSWFTGLISV